jgi:hypothetical protein
MSADTSEGPVHAHASDEFIVGTRYLRVKSDGSVSRGSVIILKFFCHSVIVFDSNLCFFVSLIYVAVYSCKHDRISGIGRSRVRNERAFDPRPGEGWDVFIFYA